MPAIDINKPLELNYTNSYKNVVLYNITEDGTITCRVTDRYGDKYTFGFDPISGVLLGRSTSENPLRIRNTSEEVANHYFQIHFGHRDWSKDQWRYAGDDATHQFTTGKQAAEKCKEYNEEARNTNSPWRFMVKSCTVMSPNHKWREWMEDRFASKEYETVPWCDEPWVIKDHFCRVSFEDPFRVAYIASEVDGVADKYTPSSAGAYLQKFYSEILSPAEIASWAVKLDKDCELFFAKTAEEMIEVYTKSGISSCMSYPAERLSSSVHPVSVYASGDLELAYLKRKSKIIARALVRPSNKAVGRTYGDIARLRDRLLSEGYIWKDGDNSKFIGAKILNLKDGNEQIVPYLDWDLSAKPFDDQYLELCVRGPISGKSTTGLASGRTTMVCGNSACSSPRFLAESSPNERYNNLQGRTWCGPCSHQHLRECHYCNGNFNVTAGDILPIANGSTGMNVDSRMCCLSCARNSSSRVVYENRVFSRSTCSSRDGQYVPKYVLNGETV